MKKRIAVLDGLRGLAILMVVFGHAGKALSGYANMLLDVGAQLGVEIFFVLSGFLITSILKNEFETLGNIEISNFYKRRALRIFPAFYVFIFCLYLLDSLGYVQISSPQFIFASFHLWNYSHLFDFWNRSLEVAQASPYLGHFWSLSLEEQFYWVWPLISMYFMRNKNLSLLKFIIFLVPVFRIVSYFLMPGSRGQLNGMFHSGIDTILIGCYFAIDRENIERKMLSAFRGNFFPISLVLALFVFIPNAQIFIGGYWTRSYGRTFDAIIIGIFLLYAVNNSEHWLGKMLGNSALVHIGKISFGFYLWQQLFVYPNKSQFFLKFPLNILASFIAANLSYYLVETIFLRIKDTMVNQSDLQQIPG